METDIAGMVAFSRKRKHGVGACVDLCRNASSEVYTEKWKLRIWHGINEGTNQRCALRDQIIIFPSKRDCHDSGLISRHAADAIAVESSTIDEESRRICPAWRFDHDFIYGALNVPHFS